MTTWPMDLAEYLFQMEDYLKRELDHKLMSIQQNW